MRTTKDTVYFNGQMFMFVNKDLQAKFKEMSLMERTDMYMLVDEALRDFLVKKNISFPNRPKIAVLQ